MQCNVPFNVIVESSPIATLIVDDAERLCFVNTAARLLLGVEPHANPSQLDSQLPIQSLISGAGGITAIHEFETTIAFVKGEHVLELIARVRPVQTSIAGEQAFWAVVELTPTRDPQWHHPSNEHVDRLVAMGQTIAGFAHEVRNPLAALKMLVEGLEWGLDPSDARVEEVARINRLVLRIEHLVKSSLQFGQPAIRLPEWHSPAALLGAAVEMVRPRLISMPTTDENRLEVQIGQNMPDVFVDPDQIQQVLVILVNNALDATGTTSAVKITVEESTRREDGARCVRFDVIDSGPGIAPDVKAQIFNPFFTTKPKGTGLGLSIALKLANQNRARILLQSEVGVGSIFSVELPAREKQRAESRDSNPAPAKITGEIFVDPSMMSPRETSS